MPLVSSGQISMGGSATNQSINVELAKSATAQISLNDSDVRTLAGIASGQISLNSFYGKSYGNTLWGWGSNLYGMLGTNNTTNYSSPVQVGSLRGWDKLEVGRYNTFSIKTDGTLWTWGYNLYGSLGTNDTTDRSSPTQIGSGTTWAKVAAGWEFTFALKTDGTMWSWGYNNTGQLATDLGTAARSSPVQVGALTTWSKLFENSTPTSHGMAIKTDGTLWVWGSNNFGALGDGTAAYKTSPVQVGSGTNWAMVGGGYYHTVAIKTDGTIWSWGWNLYGQLGYNTNELQPGYYYCDNGGLETDLFYGCCGDEQSACIYCPGDCCAYCTNGGALYYQPDYYYPSNKSSPVQIGSGTNWSKMTAAYYHTLAIKTDGTLWAWGYNTGGQLGIGNTTNPAVAYSPIQVGSATNWISVQASTAHSQATRS